MVSILRWIAVLPGSALLAILATVPLHFFLYQTLTGSGLIHPYPPAPERILTPSIVAIGFIWAGFRIAPHHKYETAIALFGLWQLGVGAFLAIGLAGASWFGRPLAIQYHGAASVGAMAGAFVGLLIVRRQSRKDLVEKDR